MKKAFTDIHTIYTEYSIYHVYIVWINSIFCKRFLEYGLLMFWHFNYYINSIGVAGCMNHFNFAALCKRFIHFF